MKPVLVLLALHCTIKRHFEPCLPIFRWCPCTHIEPMRYRECCFYLPNLCSFGDLAVAFEGDPLHCRSFIWYILVDLTSIKNTLHEVSRKLIWETMFIYIKCNVSIKFNNGSSIVSITVACYKNKWFGKMAKRFKCLNILPLVSKYMQYCGIYI